MRVVRMPDGSVSVDEPTQPRIDGRGVYLCRQAACIAQASKRQSLRRALHVEIPEAIHARLCLLVTDSDGPALLDK